MDSTEQKSPVAPEKAPEKAPAKKAAKNPDKRAGRALLIGMLLVILVVAGVAIAGFKLMTPPPEILEGQAEGTTVRIAGKLPGRVVEFYVQEGDTVHAGDTLVHIHSTIADAQLSQAVAMEDVAKAQNRKVDAGTRKQIIESAYDVWQQAEAAKGIAKKTYERLDTLFKEGVMTEQKRDEARAAYEAAVAGANAAKSQYDLALSGAQVEDKQSAKAMVTAAKGNVTQVKAVLEDAYLTAPFDGTIDQIYSQVGELVALGAPVMDLLKTDQRWVTFNVRENMLKDFTMGKKMNIVIPALGDKTVEAEVYYIRDMGSYATWRATKTTGEWDSRTFQVKLRPTTEVPDLRPGMTALIRK